MQKFLLCLAVTGILAVSGCSGSDTEGDANSTDAGTEPAAAIDDTTIETDIDVLVDEEPYIEPVDDPVPQYGPNDIVMAITDRDGTVRLLLTPSRLSMTLTKEAFNRLQTGVNQRGLRDDLKKAVLDSVEQVVREEVQSVVDQGVQKLLGHRIAYPLSAVNSMFYRDGRLWFDIEQEKPLSFDDVRTRDGRPVLANFEEGDALAFVEAFDSLY